MVKHSLKRERENYKDINAVAVVKDGRTVGHVLKNLAPHFWFFLVRDFNKGLWEIAGERVNRGGGYDFEIPCISMAQDSSLDAWLIYQTLSVCAGRELNPPKTAKTSKILLTSKIQDF